MRQVKFYRHAQLFLGGSLQLALSARVKERSVIRTDITDYGKCAKLAEWKITRPESKDLGPIDQRRISPPIWFYSVPYPSSQSIHM